ncbi:MAG: NAD(P)-binding protein [Magnetococcales bacterium]|nr:NAD(P)-binding protein [Magnetococcales bacterium]
MEKPFAITLDPGSSLSNRTGSWRTFRPVYVDRLPPCNATCPAGENIQHWLYHAEEGDYRGAWDEIMRNNPMPAIMGRACYHTCENACNRNNLDATVGIHAVERFLGDLAIEKGWFVKVDAPPTGKNVMVIGSGPGGLSAAYHLTLLGHKAAIFEAMPHAGGMMRYGIPRYRLPIKVLDAEISRIEAMGVPIYLNTRVSDLKATMKERGFHAAFVSVGAWAPKRQDVTNDGSVKVAYAIDILRSIEEGGMPAEIGKRVVIVGGGNVAIDAARTAVRLGAEEVIIAYRRTRERMPAHQFEIHEALEEGVKLHTLRRVNECKEGYIILDKMVLDDTGWPVPTGQLEYLEADTIVMALGQDVDAPFLDHVSGVEKKEGNLLINDHMMTGADGIFAGGDMVPSDRTMTTAVGHGKKAARNIDAWLRGETYQPPKKHPVATFESLNTWYYEDAPPTVQPQLDIIRRQSGFAEVLGNLDEANALFEARRCLSCGNCFECDNCYSICPDNAITKLGPGRRFSFKYDYCKGCSLCVKECPCGAILTITEST